MVVCGSKWRWRYQTPNSATYTTHVTVGGLKLALSLTQARLFW